MRSATTACDRTLALAVVLATAACEVATGGAFASASVGVGGSVGDDAGDTSTSASDDQVGKTDDGTGDLPKPGLEDESSTTGIDETSTGADEPESTSDAATSTGPFETDGESSSGEMPAADPWSPCFGGGCGDGMACMSEPMQEGVCTQPCMPAGDATSCPPAPDGDADTTCISLQGASWCALDCSHGAQCPAGTTCRALADDLGAIVICL